MLTNFILNLTVPGMSRQLTSQQRTRCGVISGITGIICNVLLVIIKITVAVFSGSIAVAADAVNNLSDAGSGIITIIEFVAGLLFNRNYSVWDYREVHYNLKGQICLPFSLLWVPVSLGAMELHKYLERGLDKLG